MDGLANEVMFEGRRMFPPFHIFPFVMRVIMRLGMTNLCITAILLCVSGIAVENNLQARELAPRVVTASLKRNKRNNL